MSTNAAREPMSAAPSLSRESRWLRLGGMGLMVVAMFAFVFLKDATDLRQLLQFGDRPNVTWIALVFLVSGNVFTLGLVLVLAGLRQLSLLTSVHARRGALARMSGASLMLLCLACLTCAGFMPLDVDTTWYVLPVFVAFVPVARVSIRLFRSGWKHEARTVEEIRAADPRRPVVYLRSFGVDDQLLVPRRGLNARLAGRLAYTVSISPEQEMSWIMEQIGPVVAIGHPGERLPELGAARLYVGDDEWRLVVGELMSDAALVVIRAGETANLWWETREALTRCSPERVIIVALGKPETLQTFQRRFTETFGKPVTPPPVPRPWGSAFLRHLFPLGSSDGKIIYFDRYAKPHEEPLVYRLTLSGAILLSYRPDRDSLQAAFRTVFAKLGLRWVARRTLMTAVLLAFFGGMFGLHHFYTGHRRRGRWYLAFCWLGFPIVLGWIDAVRLALLDDTQFQSRLKSGPVPQDGRT